MQHLFLDNGEIVMNIVGVKEVYLIFKTHLDVGFTDFASNVTAQYFSRFIPEAIQTARVLRQEGRPERFVWTTGSWLIYLYLEQASLQERRMLEEAIEAGDLVWHGLPFTTHSELMDSSLFEYGLSLARQLDRRFGKRTIAAKMTDVPGHTRGIVPLLAQAGIAFLHIGVNLASKPPSVPPLFVWRDPSGADIIVMYDKGSYGGFQVFPGTGKVMAFAHTYDNIGPQPKEEVIAIYQRMQEQFPGARILASNLNVCANELQKIKSQLPIIDNEIGDSWIHGVGTDPKKVSHFRELSRLRCRWLAEGKATINDKHFADFSRFLLMIPEHTWGLDEKSYLADRTNYDATHFRTARTQEKFRRFEASWDEQRGYLRDAVKALDKSPLAGEAVRRLEDIEPILPDKAGFYQIVDGSTVFETACFKVGFDAQNGSITCLMNKNTGRQWTSPEHPFALFHYESFSQEDYDRFWKQYIVNKQEMALWARQDFTKPGIQSVAREHKSWSPLLRAIYMRKVEADHQFLLELAMPEESYSIYGCPRRLTLGVTFPGQEPIMHIDFQWFDKAACRLPEALWLSFVPQVPDARLWRMEKLGELISPYEVIHDGNRKLHAVGTGVYYSDSRYQLTIETLDAPLVAPGEPSLLNFNQKQPDLKKGLHFNLYNNVWGTNFPMWYDEDARFRFVLKLRG